MAWSREGTCQGYAARPKGPRSLILYAFRVVLGMIRGAVPASGLFPGNIAVPLNPFFVHQLKEVSL